MNSRLLLTGSLGGQHLFITFILKIFFQTHKSHLGLSTGEVFGPVQQLSPVYLSIYLTKLNCINYITFIEKIILKVEQGLAR
jgi:hypothetical protein